MRLCFALAALSCAALAQSLPELRTEPVPAGSIFHVKNTAAKPLAACLIELVDYPGSNYYLLVEDPLAPGAEKSIPVANMTVGAVPDYVKITAAVYADGSTAGAPEKAAAMVEARKAAEETTRDVIARIEKASDPAAASAGLKTWAESLPRPGRRPTAQDLRASAARGVVSQAIALLADHSIQQTIAALRERARPMR